MSFPIPENEEARLAALRACEILDTDPEHEFDSLTRLAAKICGTPIAYIALLDSERQWFKSKVGIERRKLLEKLPSVPTPSWAISRCWCRTCGRIPASRITRW